jgi:hypothetical protein
LTSASKIVLPAKFRIFFVVSMFQEIAAPHLSKEFQAEISKKLALNLKDFHSQILALFSRIYETNNHH